MPRPDKRTSRAGLLLVEAGLAAVVIAVGLVFVSRNLSGQLNAVQRLEELDGALAVGQSALVTLEGERLAGLAFPSDAGGEMPQGARRYAWALEQVLRSDWLDALDTPLMGEAHVFVRQGEGESVRARLDALWPAPWLSPEP